ncbi:MAG: hypothetical protein AABX11_01825 [Nanoarchaeota archaeon]
MYNIIISKPSSWEFYFVEAFSIGVAKTDKNRFNKNYFFHIAPCERHYLLFTPLIYGDLNSFETFPRAIGHSPTESCEKMIKLIQEHLPVFWGRLQNLGGVREMIDRTGEKILEGWKEPHPLEYT